MRNLRFTISVASMAVGVAVLILWIVSYVQSYPDSNPCHLYSATQPAADFALLLLGIFAFFTGLLSVGFAFPKKFHSPG